MKTTFKKSALAFLTCILALAFALTGCSGGGKDPKANFVGSWQYSGGTLDGEELTDEYMDMLKEWGLNCILILDEDGTGVLDMFLEVADLKWEAKDATTVTITAEDESHDLKLKDDKLVLEVDGDKLIFTKSDKDLSGTVKKDRENAEKEEEIDEAVEDDDVQSIEISPAVTVADDDLCTITYLRTVDDYLAFMLHLLEPDPKALVPDTAESGAPVTELLQRIYTCIADSYDDCSFSLQDVAAKLDLSSGYLSQYFKQQTGDTLTSYVADLRIRKGPGTNYGSRGFTGKGVFTIVAEATGKGASKWGLLKSFAGKRNGWISLDYVKKV